VPAAPRLIFFRLPNTAPQVPATSQPTSSPINPRVNTSPRLNSSTMPRIRCRALPTLRAPVSIQTPMTRSVHHSATTTHLEQITNRSRDIIDSLNSHHRQQAHPHSFPPDPSPRFSPRQPASNHRRPSLPLPRLCPHFSPSSPSRPALSQRLLLWACVVLHTTPRVESRSAVMDSWPGTKLKRDASLLRAGGQRDVRL
jgi:hypothetical protein